MSGQAVAGDCQNEQGHGCEWQEPGAQPAAEKAVLPVAQAAYAENPVGLPGGPTADAEHPAISHGEQAERVELPGEKTAAVWAVLVLPRG